MAAPLAERIDSLAAARTYASARCLIAHERSARMVSPVVLLLLRPRSALRCSHRKNFATTESLNGTDPSLKPPRLTDIDPRRRHLAQRPCVG